MKEIRTPHHSPAPWTLAVLVIVVLVKWTPSRRVHGVGADIGSTAVKADAWHHMTDAVTSAAAFLGILVAVVGMRKGGGANWAAADDWAALVASLVIAYDGVSMLPPAVADLMDRMPGEDVVGPVREAARQMPLADAHVLGGKVKGAIRTAVPQVQSVLMHTWSRSRPVRSLSKIEEGVAGRTKTRIVGGIQCDAHACSCSRCLPPRALARATIHTAAPRTSQRERSRVAQPRITPRLRDARRLPPA